MTELSQQISYLSAPPNMHMCQICHECYPKKWCADLCFYCKNFLPTRDTRYSILKDIEWYFIKSGEDIRNVFYNEYIMYLNKWCTVFRIGYKKEERCMELELRNAL